MVCWEVMLSKGQEWDWLGDPFYRVQALLILFMLGLGGLIYRELHLRNPLVALRTLAEPKFWHLLRYYLLRLRSALRQQHFNSRLAAVPFWLRRNHLGVGSIAIRNLRDHHARCRRRPAIARSRCPIPDGGRTTHNGAGKLLDGSPQPGDQSVAGGLAEGARGITPSPDCGTAKFVIRATKSL